MRSRVDELVEGLIADGELDDVTAYLEQGRPFASMAVETLNLAWVAALKAVAFGDDARLDELAELGAELWLRGLPTPEHLVRPRAMAALQRRVLDSTPEDVEAVAEHMGRTWKRWQSDAPGRN
jgi:hypothetical protein